MLIFCVTWGFAPAAHAGYSPGAPGIGDPYFPLQGNGGYDIDHYAISLRFDPAGTSMTAQTTITAHATSLLSSFDLDFKGMNVDSITLDGRPTGWTRDGQKLVVPAFPRLRPGTTFTVTVAYHGTPDNGSSGYNGRPSQGWVHTLDGMVILSEPNGASTWIPSNDHPSDKATFDFTITTPSGVAAIANGEPGRTTTSPDGWNTVTWRERKPMATYLAQVAIGDYDVHTYRLKHGVTAIDAVGRRVRGDDEELRRQQDVLDFLTNRLGRYPFNTVGAIISSENLGGFAMENQTRPVYGSSFFSGNNNPMATTVMAHELAHQWFGDSVSLGRWKDIWLNEGFATYMQWLWNEQDGRQTIEEQFQAYACTGQTHWPAPPGIWWPPPGDPGPDNMFSDAVYDRGAMTLHMLRKTIGDRTFFKVMRTWAQPDDGSPRTTDQIYPTRRRTLAEGPNPIIHDMALHASKTRRDLLDLYAVDRPRRSTTRVHNSAQPLPVASQVQWNGQSTWYAYVTRSQAPAPTR